MVFLVSKAESALDEFGAIKGIHIAVDEELSGEDWFPPWPYMGYNLPFPTDMVKVREKGTSFQGLYHRTNGLVLPCVFPSIKVLNTTDRLLLVARPRSHLSNLVCGVTGKLLFAGLVSIRARRTDNPLVTKYLVKVRKKVRGHRVHELLTMREQDNDTVFQRVLTRIS